MCVTSPQPCTFDQLLLRADALAASGRRSLLGITGAPGAGKSTLAAGLADALGADRAVVVPMDGFHLDQRVLERLGRADRKGAPDTFDATGYVALLARLATPVVGVPVRAPRFDRDLEQPIAGAIEVPAHVPLVITEGNYLLFDGPWAGAAPLLSSTWFLAPHESVRVERLIARHVRFGRPPLAARAWALGPDQANAEAIAATATRADRVIALEEGSPAR